MKEIHGINVDPVTDIAICCGQSEAFAATILPIIDRGDEVILFDPAYETYDTCIRLAGGVPVYEHVTFDNEKHVSIASLPEMQRRTIIMPLLSKTFSVTGRVGWAIATSSIASAIRNIHTKITDSAPAPFQEATLTALNSPPSYFDILRRDYESKRAYMVSLLAEVGFNVQFTPHGSFFVFAQLPEHCALYDVEFVEELIEQAGVVAVPGHGFFHAKPLSTKYIRFAFCKGEDTLAAASEKIRSLADERGYLKLF